MCMFFKFGQCNQELLVVVGGGAAGIYGAIWAKTVAPKLNVIVIEKGQPLSKVKISGGGRCNVTNGHCPDNVIMAEQYPRGNKELKGSFFSMHSPLDTMSWFTMSVQTGKTVTSATSKATGKFDLGIVMRSSSTADLVETDYLLIATGSSKQGYGLAGQLGHTIIDPVPSLFTFKIKDSNLAELSGVGPMLVTHWGLSGPAILRLSAWSARDLYGSNYKGTLILDFAPDILKEGVKSILLKQKKNFAKQKVVNSSPSEFNLVKRFWRYLLKREGFVEDILWASISSDALLSITSLLKQCPFEVTGKGQFKDEFVTAGGIPLSEILNVDGITGGFNFQNAWTGGYIAGTSIGDLAASSRRST
uniref:Aminoacetone oxidase family FAD-binding enzyme n=1 Tax=Chenopodium quinoa TaxID=63459 RepID=A0A803LSV2_CHEQI